MSNSPLREIELLFQIVVELPSHERSAWLDERCGNDDPLRQLVEALLREHESQTIPLLKSAEPADNGGDIAREGRIGPYRMLKVLGEGGCGTVFLAHQDEPIRRDVALKVIKPGMDTRQVIARFEAERHTLALMEHPNVARVLDAGVTDAGRSYFVMEYVPGTAINTYCDAKRLDISQRLHLFIQVCEAVQHAHQKGIIHRDIKSSNVLVEEIDGRAIPKVIDFGIAKAMSEESRSGTLQTEQGQVLGTPAYMSPEQVALSPDEIDTRSDVYSLGLLLYELLTGAYPFGDALLNSSHFEDLRKIVLTREAPRPSTRNTDTAPDAARIAAARGVDLHGLRRRLRGDLDWITLKAMEKDRARRYVTVQELIADLNRHLNHQPVEARPPRWTYLAEKFIRRRRALVVSGSIVVFALVGGFIAAMIGMKEAQRSERSSQQQAYRAHIAAAQAGIQTQNGALAWRSLNVAAEPLRNWEWRLLRRMVGGDGSAGRIPGAIVRRCGCSADGQLIAFAQSDSVRVWDRSAEAFIGTSKLGELVDRISISPDHTRLLVGGPARITMFALPGGEALWSRNDGADFSPAQFAADSSVVLIGRVPGGQLAFLNPQDGGLLRRRLVSSGAALAPRATRDHRKLIYADGNGWIVVMDAESGAEKWRCRGELIALLQDDQHIVILPEPNASKWSVWSLDTGSEAYSVSRLGESRDLFQGPDGRFGVLDGYRVTSLDEEHAPAAAWLAPAPPLLLQPVRDTHELLAICEDGAVWRCDWNNSGAPFRIAAPFATNVRGASISPDGGTVATMSWGGVLAWDAHTGVLLWSRYLTRSDLSLAFSPDAAQIAAATEDHRVFVLDARDGHVALTLETPETVVTRFAWSPAGEALMLGAADGRLYRLTLTEGAKLQPIGRVGDSAIRALAVSPNNRLIAAGGSDGCVRLLDAQTGAMLAELRFAASEGGVSVIFSRDGESVLTTGAEPSVARWSTRNGARLETYEGPPGGVQAVCVSPDGTRIVAASSGMIYVWDAHAPTPLLEIEGTESVAALTFNSSGSTLLASGGQNVLVAYETDKSPGVSTQRAAALRSRRIVDRLWTESVSDDVIARLQSDKTLSSEQCAAAIAFVRAYGDPPTTMNSRAWAIARDPRRSAEEYRVGLRYSQAALKTWPDAASFLNTLGMLQYRLGDFEAALLTLERSDVACRKERGGPHPADTAALALVHQRLDHAAAAQAALKLTRELLSNPVLAADADNQALFNEAKAAVEIAQ